MANVKGIDIQKKSGNLTAQTRSADMISALIAPVATKPSGFSSFGEIKQIFSVKDAEAIGIDSSYDDTNDELLYWNITEFYRMNPEGPKLYVMPVSSSSGSPITFTDIFDDPNNNYARKLVNQTDGEIRQLGLMINDAHLSGNNVVNP